MSCFDRGDRRQHDAARLCTLQRVSPLPAVLEGRQSPGGSVGVARSHAASNGLIWPQAGCASIASAATAVSDYFPPPAALHRETK